jgi:transposase
LYFGTTALVQSDAEAASIAGINGIRLHSLNILVRLAARDAYVDMPRTSRTVANSMRGGERLLLAEMKVPTFDGHLNVSNTDLRRCSMECTPRRKLTREFKLEAVRQVALSEKPKAQLARELGVRVGQLRTWRLEFEKEAVTGIAKPDRSAAEDLEQLRRENAKLKMEIEILKKAAIYFAREAK